MQDSERTLELTGPAVELAPKDALALGLALHELATNAAKFGALSVPEGKVTIAWKLIAPDLARIESIAVGALRVYMSRFSRSKVIAFDFDEALAFEGDTGPYLQYAAVRAADNFRKLEEQGLPGRLTEDEVAAVKDLPAGRLDDGLWDVVRTCGRTPETFEKVAETLEVSLLVRHALAVAASFHHLYHTHPVLQAPDGESRRARRAALQLVERTLADILDVLGVPVPERM